MEMRMKKTVLALLSSLLMISFIFAQDGSLTGKKAPDFVLKTTEGDNYKLSENIGTGPIVINFWATWCIPCIEELKHLKNIYKKYFEKNVQFLAIAIDDPKTVGRVNSFVKSHNYPYKILLDTNSEVINLYQSKVPPYTVLIDQAGQIIYTHVGYRMGDEKELEKQLEKLFEETSE
jgi:cytochrome c biogenesis protein CcmG, thiol:disulfide interchange protein DsbE